MIPNIVKYRKYIINVENKHRFTRINLKRVITFIHHTVIYKKYVSYFVYEN